MTFSRRRFLKLAAGSSLALPLLQMPMLGRAQTSESRRALGGAGAGPRPREGPGGARPRDAPADGRRERPRRAPVIPGRRCRRQGTMYTSR